jgi:cytidylate kinase
VNAITIDGPAASGKSTVGYATAQRLDFLFFDTGIMYRAVTWAILEQGLNVADSAAVGRVAGQLPIEISAPQSDHTDERLETVQIGEQDITWAVRTPRVDQNVSTVAANGQVRRALSRQQRRIGLMYSSGAGGKAGVVMVGRDIGTVVLPEAPLKIYLDAPVEERARRRYQELAQRGTEAELTQIVDDMQRRDEIDSQRAIAPLHPAEDAHRIQTLELSVRQIVDHIVALARMRLELDAALSDRRSALPGSK